MNARQHQFPEPGICQSFRLGAHVLRRPGTDASPHIGNDAIGAVAVAALLNFHGGAGMLGKTADAQRFKWGSEQILFHGAYPLPACHRFLQQAHHLAPVSIADDQPRPRFLQQLRPVPLRHAPGDDHLRGRIQPQGAAHRLHALFISRPGHGAGVDHIDVRGLVKRPHLITRLLKQFQHRLGIVLVHLAPQGMKRDRRHTQSFPFLTRH